MYIFLIIWSVFVLAYIIFNIYGLSQVIVKRFKGDAIGLAVLVYLIIIFLIIFISLLIISRLDWGRPINNIIKIF